MLTLRARTTLLATAVTAVVLVAAAVLLLTTLSAQLTSNGDAVDRAQVRELLARAADGDLPPTLSTLGDESVAQVLDAEGAVVAATPNAQDGRAFVTAAPAGSGALEQATLDGPDDGETETYRVWVGRGPSPDGAVTVVVGRSVESVDEATRTLRRSLLVGVPMLLALLAAVTWLVVGRALARIDAITTTVAGIGGVDDSDLGRRVPESAVDDEVGRLASTMNGMLDRLEESARRQRAFVADASHDLQSPLTGLRAQLETALASPGEVDVESWARQMLGSSADMERLVQDLLALALTEGTTPSLTTSLLDLDQVVLEEAARARPATEVAIDTSGVSAAPVLGDAQALHRLARNLIDNAVRHASRRVTLTLVSGPDAVVLEVSDDGPGVPAADRERVFDRFYRGDPARRHGAGSGLGLAIARRLAEQHGGTLVVAGAEGEPSSRFRLILPLPDH